MDTERERLTAHWERFLTRFGKADTGKSPILKTLLTRYGAPGRHYHAYWHINGGLDLLEEARRDAPGAFENPLNDAAIELGFFDHDLIYDATRSDNEKRSAQLAATHARQLGFPAGVGVLVKEAIIATEHTHGTIYLAARIVCDIDLATLAAPWERFCENTAMIRREYSHIESDAVFSAGRKAFFAKMLDSAQRPRIYQTDYFHDRFEAAARANLERVVDST